MNAVSTVGIVLSRTNFGEADRIVTVLTPDHGKVRLMAKGARKQGSKLAGGIELLSVSQISFIPGRKDISTLISSRIDRHFGAIVKDIERTMYAYELLKMFNRHTEDLPDSVYFDLLEKSLAALEQPENRIEMIDFWSKLKLLEHGGHGLNLKHDGNQQPLSEEQNYFFNIEHMVLQPHDQGDLDARHIKILKWALRVDDPTVLTRIEGADPVVVDLHRLVTVVAREYL